MASSQSRSSAVMVFVITAVTVLLYARCLSFDYIYCDDNLFILDNETYNRTIGNIVGSFTSTLTQTSSYYRPVFSSSFIVEEQIGGTSPRLHHLTNLLFHLLGTSLLFATLLKLGYPKGLSLGATLVFAVHPLMVPATAWISGRLTRPNSPMRSARRPRRSWSGVGSSLCAN